MNWKQRIKLAGKVLLKGIDPMKPQSQGYATRDIPAISPEEVAEAKLFFPMEKFFIFGHARSGTTLLARLVRLHPEVHCNWQLHPFTRPPLLKTLVADPEVEAWLKRRSNRWNRGADSLPHDLSPMVLRAACDLILEREARRLGKCIVGDKSPNGLLDGEAVKLMHDVYPDARLVFIVRDGRDTAISHRFQTFIDSPQHLASEDLQLRDEFVRQPEPFLHGDRSIFTEKGIRRAAEGWVRNLVETDRAGRELYSEHYLVIRYEDLLAQPWEIMSHLWEFLGAATSSTGLTPQIVLTEMQSNPDADWQQKKSSEIAQALQKGRAGTWQEMFTPRDRQVFNEIASEILKTWGYSS